jgi:hypothetical protein
MEAIFFVSRPEDAMGVTCVEDLPGDSAAEPLLLESLGALSGLVEALLGGASDALRPMRDATCRSFPVWAFSDETHEAISQLDAVATEQVARSWHEYAADSLGDADLYDLSLCLEDLRDALRLRAPGERLFVLLEEKAW